MDGNAFAATLDRFGHSRSGGGRLVHTVHISGHAVRRSALKGQLGWAGSGRTGLPGGRLGIAPTRGSPEPAQPLTRCDNGGIHQVLAALLLLRAD